MGSGRALRGGDREGMAAAGPRAGERSGGGQGWHVRGPGPLAAGPELGLGRMVREIAGD